nr:MAG TPA: hypothetical protein [Bacteriophage sp.]
MEIISKIVITLLFTIGCLGIIIEGINKSMIEYNKKREQLYNILLEQYQQECKKTDTLYKILFQIRHELSFLKLKDCPEEEFRNIPFEIIDWIDKLEKISKEVDCNE